MAIKSLIFMVCLSASAQLPTIPSGFNFPPSQTIPACVQATYSVSSATLVGGYVSCGSTSITNTVDGSFITNWFDISSTGNTLIKDPATHTSFFPPVYRQSIGPSGNHCVDFQYPAGVFAGRVLISSSSFSKSQPLTYIFAISITNSPPTNDGTTSRQCMMDSSGFGRNDLAMGVPTGNNGEWNAGSLITPTPQLNDTNWMVWTVIFDGASSVIFTNGPGRSRGIYLTGNPGSQGVGTFVLGSDASVAGALWARMCAVLVYTGHMFTNDIDTISTTLHNQFSF